MHIRIILVVVALSMASCKPIVKTIYGVKKPALETDASIKAYLKQHEIDSSRVITFPSLLSFAAASQQQYLSIPDAMFFNKDGFLVPYKPTAQSCNADVSKFIDDLRNFKSKPVDSRVTLPIFQGMLQQKQEQTPAEITVYITWSKFSGRLNKTKAFEWVKALEKARREGLQVSYYLLNCDFQKRWNLSEEQIKRLDLR